MQEDFAKIGVTVEIVSYEWAEYLERSKAKDRDGAVILGWTGDNGDPDNFLDVLLGCDAVGGNNRAQWCNEEFDKLVSAAKVTADQAERTKLYEEAQVVFKREAPWATLDHSLVVMPMSKKVTGYRHGSARHPPLRRRRHRRVSRRLDRHGASRKRGAPLAGAARQGRLAGRSRGPGVLRFVLGRLLVLIPTFIGVSIIAFSFIRLLPGDPVMLMSGERVMDPARYEKIMHELGYDRPLVVQYLDYLGGLVTGDFGTSIVTKRPVLQDFFTLFPATLELSLCAILFAVILGIPAGILAAVKRGSFYDQSIMSVALIGYSMPIFWWGILLIILFSGMLGWTPVSGRISLMYFFPSVTGFMLIDSLLSGQSGAFRSALSHLILPTIVLGTIPLAVIARQTRSAMLEVLGEDYVRTARAKGLPPRRVVGLHALRNALIPGHHHDRPAGRRADGRRHPDRVDLLLARDRQVDDQFRLEARLPGHPGRAPDHRGDHHAREPERRPALRPHQPAHPAPLRATWP